MYLDAEAFLRCHKVDIDLNKIVTKTNDVTMQLEQLNKLILSPYWDEIHKNDCTKVIENYKLWVGSIQDNILFQSSGNSKITTSKTLFDLFGHYKMFFEDKTINNILMLNAESTLDKLVLV